MTYSEFGEYCATHHCDINCEYGRESKVCRKFVNKFEMTAGFFHDFENLYQQWIRIKNDEMADDHQE